MLALSWRRRYRWFGCYLLDLQMHGAGATDRRPSAFQSGMSRLWRQRQASATLFAVQGQRHSVENRKCEGAHTCRGRSAARACAFRKKAKAGAGCAAWRSLIVTNVGKHQYFTRKGDNIYHGSAYGAGSSARRGLKCANGRRQSAAADRAGNAIGTKFRCAAVGRPPARCYVRGDQFVEVRLCCRR